MIPDTARFGGTLRFFSDRVRELAQSRVRDICHGFAMAHGISIDIQFREIFDVLINNGEAADALMAAAAEIVGEEAVRDDERLSGGSEDFADMLHEVPGAYGWLSHGGSVPLHNPGFVLDEAILPVGASILARIAERQLGTRA